MDGLYKILLFIGGGVIVLLVIMFGIRQFRNTQDQANAIGTQISDKVNNALELTYTQYDGKVISGADVVNVIKDTYASSDYVQVAVKTSGMGTAQIYVTDRAFTTPTATTTTLGPGTKVTTFDMHGAETKTDAGYISPTGKFKGFISRDANGTIVQLYFEQQ